MGIGESNLTFDKDNTLSPAVRNKHVREEYDIQGNYVKVEKQTTTIRKRGKSTGGGSKNNIHQSDNLTNIGDDQ